MTKLYLAIFYIVLIYPSWAIDAAEERYIYYYTGCDNVEIYSDIKVSISGITRFAEENDIHVVFEEKSNKCGYLFVYGNKSRYIRSVMTDIDLLLLSKKFFGIE